MRLRDAIAALVLPALAGFMAWLPLWGDYWYFLNPKFQWLTLTAAAVTGLLGLAAALRAITGGRGAGGTAGSLIVFGFLFLCIIAAETRSFPRADLPPDPNAEATVPEPARLTPDGPLYMPINTMELFTLLDDAGAADLEGGYILQGTIGRTPELDALGEIALVRPAMWCCLADAVAVGFRIRVEDPADYEPGAWYRIHGRLVPLTPPKELQTPVKTQQVFATFLHQEYALTPDRLTSIDEPAVPFAYTFREQAPFGY